MGFLSRKKPKPAPVEIAEERQIVDDLQEMEEAVPERGVEEPRPRDVEEPRSRDEGDWAAGPVSDTTSSPTGDDPASSPPTAEAAVVDAPAPAVEEAPEVEEAEEAALNAGSEDEEEGPARMKAVDLLAPTRLDFLKEKEVEEEAPVKTADVIAFANQKGGVAKTTTTLNLAVAFAESGYRVLCIDLDPQGNLTMSQGIDPDKVEKSLYDVLVNDMPISEIIVKREIDIAVASIDLAGAEIAMSTKIGRERSLEKALKEVQGDYDFVCIDTPPSLGLLTINALTVANKVIVPVQCEYLSMRGLVQLQNTLRMIQENLNPEVRIEGILPTMLDSRTIHAKEAVEILEENFGDLVFRSRIKKAIKFAEAPVKGASVLKYDSESSAANYYRELAKEVLSHGSA
jgi:chromosome partitioning protein